MQAVIYIRVSSDEQIHGTSLATQEAACRDWCARHDYAVGKVFSDAGESAKTADRPQFVALLSWCAEHKPAVCVVWKFDRWARNSTDHAVASQSLAKHGTRLVSATEAAADDPAGRLLTTILSGIAQFDNEVRAERTKHGMRAIAAAGGWYTIPPFGFRISREGRLPVLLPDPDKAPIVRELFAGIAEGRRNQAQTIEWAHTKHSLSEAAARRLLRATVYGGFIRGPLTGNREVETAFPGLVDRQQWDDVQAILDGRRHNYGRRAETREEFPLRGILRCGVCNHPLTACHARGKCRKYPYYQCKHGHVRRGVEAVDGQWIAVLREFGARLSPPLIHLQDRLRLALAERSEAGLTVRLGSRAEQDRLQQQRTRLLDAYQVGALSRSDWIARDNEIAERIKHAAEQETRTNPWADNVHAAVANLVHLLSNPAALWEHMNLENRRRFAGTFFGASALLMPDGTIQTPEKDGLAGLLSEIDPKTGEWYPLEGERLNTFVRLAGALAGVAA